MTTLVHPFVLMFKSDMIFILTKSLHLDSTLNTLVIMKCSLFLQVSFQEVFQLKFLATLNTSQTFTENKQQSKCKQTAERSKYLFTFDLYVHECRHETWIFQHLLNWNMNSKCYICNVGNGFWLGGLINQFLWCNVPDIIGKRIFCSSPSWNDVKAEDLEHSLLMVLANCNQWNLGVYSNLLKK